MSKFKTKIQIEDLKKGSVVEFICDASDLDINEGIYESGGKQYNIPYSQIREVKPINWKLLGWAFVALTPFVIYFLTRNG